MLEHVVHSFPPCYDADSRVLILGSMPSPKSREVSFYYGHPQNRFWKVLSAVFGEEIPTEISAKKEWLHAHHIALWDVLAECDIQGASDSTIQNPVPNRIEKILDTSDIQAIFTTGNTAHRFYQRLCLPYTKKQDICLPSTSPANCRVNMKELVRHYQRIRTYLF